MQGSSCLLINEEKLNVLLVVLCIVIPLICIVIIVFGCWKIRKIMKRNRRFQNYSDGVGAATDVKLENGETDIEN